MKIENPPGFIVRTEAQKAAFDNGFRLEHGNESGWLRYGSTTTEGNIWIAGCSGTGPWLLSVEHAGVQAEIGLPSLVEMPGPGNARFVFDTLRDLYTALDRVYRLAMSLPDAPLRQFYGETAGMARESEIQRLAVQRIGQTLFRQALLRYWNGCCPLTGIAEEPLLRASHIIPWSECGTDKLRLDVHNGLLLSALWDAAFDSGLVSFADDGTILKSPTLTGPAVEALDLKKSKFLKGLTDSHRANLARHRLMHGYLMPRSILS
jgi:hypothetical protein